MQEKAELLEELAHLRHLNCALNQSLRRPDRERDRMAAGPSDAGPDPSGGGGGGGGGKPAAAAVGGGRAGPAAAAQPLRAGLLARGGGGDGGSSLSDDSEDYDAFGSGGRGRGAAGGAWRPAGRPDDSDMGRLGRFSLTDL